MPTAPASSAPRLFSEPQKPTSRAPPVSVTTTCPGRICSRKPTVPTSLNQMPCAPTISSVVPRRHIGRLAGTQRTVKAAPQKRTPGQSGRISGDSSPMSK
jgi:hypothetical protein